jgi:hypothetical protein
MSQENKTDIDPCCEPSACCGSASKEGKPVSYFQESSDWVDRRLDTPAGSIPIVKRALSRADQRGIVRVRLGIGRMNYKIKPGLYGVGNPDSGSPVFVSANYKLSFDMLRKELSGLNGWVLVLDTKGINVWCAAGKGTFGTDELVRRVEDTGLANVVSHRTLILPQLGAPGVAAHEVTRRSRFKVIYGPVRASDIRAFLKAGGKATPEMRRVRFTFRDRAVLTPMELAPALKYLLIIAAVLWVLNIFGLHFLSWKGLYTYLGAILVGGFFVPVLLPWIPGRAFAFKGWLLGLGWAFFVNVYQGWILSPSSDWRQAAVNFLLLPALSAFLAMTFTGSSSYTSLSGVLKEMRFAVPPIFISAGVGLGLLVMLMIGIF